MKNLNVQLKKYNIVAVCIRAYQRTISPDHGMLKLFFGNSRCRFYPSCSAYALAAIRQYGLLRGSIAAFVRIAKCHPWNPGGYDPV